MKRFAQKLKRYLFERDMSLWSVLYIYLAVIVANGMGAAGYGAVEQVFVGGSIIAIGAYIEMVIA